MTVLLLQAETLCCFLKVESRVIAVSPYPQAGASPGQHAL